VQYYRCQDRRCRGRCRVKTSGATVTSGTHTCSESEMRHKDERKRFINSVSSQLSENYQPVPRAISSAMTTAVGALTLPSRKRLQESVWRRLRNSGQIGQGSSLPSDVRVNGESCVKADFSVGEKRVIGFSTEKLMKILMDSETCLGDGTFSVCPRPFYQLYIFYGFFNSACIPCFFSFV